MPGIVKPIPARIPISSNAVLPLGILIVPAEAVLLVVSTLLAALRNASDSLAVLAVLEAVLKASAVLVALVKPLAATPAILP